MSNDNLTPEQISFLNLLRIREYHPWDLFHEKVLFDEKQIESEELVQMMEKLNMLGNEVYNLYGKPEWADARVKRDSYEKEIELKKIEESLSQEGIIGPAIILHKEGGYEGGGEHVELVVHFPKYDYYLKAFATYTSYHGIDDWEEFKFVQPTQRMVTFYE